jgi:hypothetical protein
MIIDIASMLAVIAYASRAEIGGVTAIIGAGAIMYVLLTRTVRTQL